MARYRNVVIPIIVKQDDNANKVTVGTESGLIKRAVIVHGELYNDGMVRASIKDSTGDKIAELQPIKIYRSRDVEYSRDGVPVNMKGGSQMTFEIISTQPFYEDFQADLILIYEEESSQQNCN